MNELLKTGETELSASYKDLYKTLLQVCFNSEKGRYENG
jgi:hypothetical protein